MISEEKLKLKIESLCNDQAKLDQIEKAIHKGVTEQYPAIQNLYNLYKAGGKDEFFHAFMNFYKVSRSNTNSKSVIDHPVKKREALNYVWCGR